MVTPLSTPKRLREILVGLDIVKPQSEPEPGMALLPEDWAHCCLASGDDSPAIACKQVSDRAAFRRWADIANKVLHGFPLLDADLYYPLCAEGKMVCFLGYFHGEPAATSATMCRDGNGTLEFIATLPEFRRTGLGTAVCRAAINHLTADNAAVISLRARAAAVPLYTSLGFKAYYWA